jgi:RNA polymerase sigma-70 factor, ECF subfamily
MLSLEHRTVVVLVHYLGLSPTEAAERMGTPAGTARSRLHYALQQLRAALEADARPATSRGTA